MKQEQEPLTKQYMKQIRINKLLTITMPVKILSDLRKHCKKNHISMSGYISKLIEDDLKLMKK